MSDTERNFVVGDFVSVKCKSGTYLGYVYDIKPLPNSARNLKIVNADNNNINLREVDSRLCSIINIISDQNMLLTFVEDNEHSDFVVGQLVRPKKGVELFYCSDDKFSSETRHKLLSPMKVVNIAEKITVSGNLEDGNLVNIEVSKILLHSY